MEIAYIVKENNQPDMEKLPDRIDAVIDFSHPNHFAWLFDFIKEKRCAYVCGTTGHSEQQKQRIEELSHFVPIVFQANFSLGVAAVSYTHLDVYKRQVTIIVSVIPISFSNITVKFLSFKTENTMTGL